MLRHRVIPVVLLDGYSVVKTIEFNVRRNLGNPIAVARIYNSRNVDELVLLDIDASKEGRHIDTLTIRDIASECFMPLSVGGGITSCEEIESVLKSGADKVVINTAALKNPRIIAEGAAHFGSQCIVASVDVRKEGTEYRVWSHAGLDVHHEAADWCRRLEASGGGEIFLNSVDLDGKMSGYDNELIRRVTEAVSIPVIACGGASGPMDCVQAIRCGASAVAAASIFHFTDFTPEDCREKMREEGIPARERSAL